jgi:DNA mismatch repair ATPase MutS
MSLRGLSPYWMDRATCTVSPVELKGLFLLTAPNMSGKSTLMRSAIVAALLANCGLCVPCSSADVAR